jgi:hypothetical protein
LLCFAFDSFSVKQRGLCFASSTQAT